MIYKSSNHAKYLLQYHIVLVSKFRRPIFDSVISNKVEELSREYLESVNVELIEVKTDVNHIHYVISTPIDVNIRDLLTSLKSYCCTLIYRDQECKHRLRRYYWYSNLLFSSGVFVVTVGNNLDIVKNYVKNQGRT